MRKESLNKATIIVYQEDLYNSVFDVMFEDLRNNPDVYFITEKDFPEKGIYRLLPSRKLKLLTFGLSPRFYLKYYRLPEVIKKLNKKYDHVSVLMHNASLIKTKYPVELLNILKKKATFNLLYIDIHEAIHSCGYANYLCQNRVFDKVFTIDPVDAEQFHMELCDTPYSKLLFPENIEKQKQLYYCGSDIRRLYTLYRIWKEAKTRNIKVVYDLTYAKSFIDFFEEDPNVHAVDHIPYKDVLKNVLASSCIIDITKEGQAALTLRPYEAVIYNRKLLTNNKYIKQFKYYDERYMHYFEVIEDIDWEWANEACSVDYGYTGDFSPNYLLEKLV